MIIGAIHWAVIVSIVVTALVLAVLVSFYIRFASLWFKCQTNQCPIPFFFLMRLYLNKMNAKEVVNTGLVLKAGGQPVEWTQIENAAIGGADLEKVAQAYLEAKSRNLKLGFTDIVDAERADRLSQILK